MQLTERERREVYVTVSIQLAEMFDVVSNAYSKPWETERRKLILEIESEICDGWKNFQRTPSKASERITSR